MHIRSTARRALPSTTLVVALVGAPLTLAQGAEAAPVASAAPATAVRVVQSASHADEFGGQAVIGRAQNVSGRTLENVRVVVDQLDPSGSVLGSTVAPVLADRLDTGETSTFEAYLAPIPGVARWVVRSPAGDPAISPANHRFTTQVVDSYTDEFGLQHVIASVRNNNSGYATRVSVGATFKDSAGTPVGTDWALVASTESLRMAPGEVGHVDVMRYGGPAHATVDLVAEGANDPSPLPTSVSISGGGSFMANKGITATGRVVKRGTDTGIAGLPVAVLTYSAYEKKWVPSPGGLSVSDARGNLRIAVPEQPFNTTIKLRVTPEGGVSASESGTVLATVVPPLKIRGDQGVEVGSGTFVKIESRYTGGPVEIQRKEGKRWVKVATARLTKHRLNFSADPQFEYRGRVEVATPRAGRIQFRAITRATQLNGAAVSNTIRVRVVPG